METFLDCGIYYYYDDWLSYIYLFRDTLQIVQGLYEYQFTMSEQVDPTAILEELQWQIANLSAYMAELKHSVPLKLPSGVKVLTPEPFKGSADSESVLNFINSLENYFALVGLSDSK